jgi:hypothetical protein
MAKKESVTSIVTKKAKKHGKAKKHPNKRESKKDYRAQGR